MHRSDIFKYRRYTWNWQDLGKKLEYLVLGKNNNKYSYWFGSVYCIKCVPSNKDVFDWVETCMIMFLNEHIGYVAHRTAETVVYPQHVSVKEMMIFFRYIFYTSLWMLASWNIVFSATVYLFRSYKKGN